MDHQHGTGAEWKRTSRQVRYVYYYNNLHATRALVSTILFPEAKMYSQMYSQMFQLTGLNVQQH